MIIKISDDGLSVRWSHDSTMNTQNWQYADIDDLINAYEKNMEDNMQRLIDANEILRSEHKRYMAHEYYVRVRDIEDTPTVDAEPVVRCKDCKYHFDGEHVYNCCEQLMEKSGWITEIPVDDNWYCADGERKEDADND